VNHPEFLSLPKGMKQVIIECGLWFNGLQMQCKDSCNLDHTTCCEKQILDLQPNFNAQCSLVQEVIEAAGHLCIVLPKFNCKLNFIEFSGVQSRNTLTTVILPLPHSKKSSKSNGFCAAQNHITG